MSSLQRLLLFAWIGLLAILAVMSIFVLPQVIQPPLSEEDRQTAETKLGRFTAEDSRRKLQNEVRTTLLQGLGTLLTFTAAGIAAYWTSRQLHVTREGQITERFTRAIDQLGSDKLDVRLGGIYALERIARDSVIDRDPIIQVLATFVREHSPWPPLPPERVKKAKEEGGDPQGGDVAVAGDLARAGEARAEEQDRAEVREGPGKDGETRSLSLCRSVRQMFKLP